MNNLTQNDSSSFMERFSSFNDAVLRTIQIAYAVNGTRNVRIVLAVKDNQTAANDGWILVDLLLSGVKDLRFCESARTSAQVLSNGLHVCWLGGGVGLELGDCIDAPESVPELLDSKLFAIGSSLEWSTAEYQS